MEDEDEDCKDNTKINAELSEFANDFMRLLNKHGNALSLLVQADGGADPGGSAMIMLQTAAISIFWRSMQDLSYDVTDDALREAFMDRLIEVAERETSGESITRFTPLN